MGSIYGLFFTSSLSPSAAIRRVASFSVVSITLGSDIDAKVLLILATSFLLKL